ncbi:MAG: hypothetical protein OIF32_11615, partial [Campylobacterales bacterium]|nr:hypothetical protein [Campylobacterales bacterium]
MVKEFLSKVQTKQYLLAFVAFQYIFLLFYGSSMSVSYAEAHSVLETETLLHIPLSFSFWMFGQNDFALRIPFVTLHMFNLLLMYQLAKSFLKTKKDALLTVFLYSLLPGVISSALIVDKAGAVIFLTLLFFVIFKRHQPTAAIFALLLSFADQGFLLLFFGMFVYSIYKKDNIFLIISIIGFTLNYGIFGFDVSGVPKGHFVQIFGIYGAIFSPFMFLYFIYSLYWFAVKYKKTLPLLWYVSFSVFILSIILSLRQNIKMEDFAVF